MSDYGWCCKRCGFYISSDDKEEIKKAKKDHKQHSCSLSHTYTVNKKGQRIITRARPDLAKQINDEAGAIEL